MNKKLFSILIILFVSLFLFYKPLLSNQPLGLDTLGHLSKVSYLKLYPFADWDMSWYSGTLFLKLYPPLFYYLTALFPNTFFAANFLSFLSIYLTSIGIYFFIRYKTQDEKVSLFSGLSYLTVLSISYYWISTGNLPYFFALWTIPFSLYFLEKSIKENKRIDFVFFCLIFTAGILIHFIVGFLIGVLMFLRFLFEGINWINIKKIFLYGAIPILLSSFWFIPFLFYSNSSAGYEGYAPDFSFLFGFGECCWGLQAGGIGVLAFLFIPALFILSFKKCWNNKLILFSLLAVFILGFLLLGKLGNHYPFGVDPVRFVLPFSIFLSIFLGLTIYKTKLFENKYLLVGLFLILFIGLLWNFTIINKNFESFSYYGENSRYEIIQEVINDKNFPLQNEFSNYRFGTSRYVFGETINYFMPHVSHNFGYQDAGMLNLQTHRDFLDAIWNSEDINKSIYYLDWFGIKYFEGTTSDSMGKFENDARFKIILKFSLNGYAFTLFEYLEAKQIISLVDYLDDDLFGKEKAFEWERENPDKVIVKYDSVDENDAVLFKEFYHKTWKAKDLESGKNLEIHKTNLGFMYINPPSDSKGIIFYQSKTIEEMIGILLSIFGIIFLLIYLRKYEN